MSLVVSVPVKFPNTMSLLPIVFCDIEIPIDKILGDLQMKVFRG